MSDPTDLAYNVLTKFDPICWCMGGRCTQDIFLINFETGSLAEWSLLFQLSWLASLALGFPASAGITGRLTSPPNLMWILELPTLGLILEGQVCYPSPISYFKLGRLPIKARLWAVVGVGNVAMLDLPFLYSNCCWNYPASYLPALGSLHSPGPLPTSVAVDVWMCYWKAGPRDLAGSWPH